MTAVPDLYFTRYVPDGPSGSATWGAERRRSDGVFVVFYPGSTYPVESPGAYGPQLGGFSTDGDRLYYSFSNAAGCELGYFRSGTDWGKTVAVTSASTSDTWPRWLRRILAISPDGSRLVATDAPKDRLNGQASADPMLYVYNTTTWAVVGSSTIDRATFPLQEPKSWWCSNAGLVYWVEIDRADTGYYSLLRINALSAGAPTNLGHVWAVGSTYPTYHARAANGDVYVLSSDQTGIEEIISPWRANTYYSPFTSVWVGANVFNAVTSGYSAGVQPRWVVSGPGGQAGQDPLGSWLIGDGSTKWAWFRATDFQAGAVKVAYFPLGTSVGAITSLPTLGGLICDGMSFSSDGTGIFARMHKPGVPYNDSANGVYGFTAAAGAVGSISKRFLLPASEYHPAGTAIIGGPVCAVGTVAVPEPPVLDENPEEVVSGGVAGTSDTKLGALQADRFSGSATQKHLVQGYLTVENQSPTTRVQGTIRLVMGTGVTALYQQTVPFNLPAGATGRRVILGIMAVVNTSSAAGSAGLLEVWARTDGASVKVAYGQALTMHLGS